MFVTPPWFSARSLANLLVSVSAVCESQFFQLCVALYVLLAASHVEPSSKSQGRQRAGKRVLAHKCCLIWNPVAGAEEGIEEDAADAGTDVGAGAGAGAGEGAEAGAGAGAGAGGAEAGAGAGADAGRGTDVEEEAEPGAGAAVTPVAAGGVFLYALSGASM